MSDSLPPQVTTSDDFKAVRSALNYLLSSPDAIAQELASDGLEALIRLGKDLDPLNLLKFTEC